MLTGFTPVNTFLEPHTISVRFFVPSNSTQTIRLLSIWTFFAVVLEYLQPFIDLSGGRLSARRVEYVAGRSNVILTYLASLPTTNVLSFVGSHLDVYVHDV